jgi:hypothetical protein
MNKSVSSDYTYKPNAMMPKGKSVLASGGGISNTPVQFTFSRSFKNVYKNAGSLSSTNSLSGLDNGGGLSKGHSILDSGRGLLGTSLFN